MVLSEMQNFKINCPDYTDLHPEECLKTSGFGTNNVSLLDSVEKER